MTVIADKSLRRSTIAWGFRGVCMNNLTSTHYTLGDKTVGMALGAVLG
jgi:hypothetical protein